MVALRLMALPLSLNPTAAALALVLTASVATQAPSCADSVFDPTLGTALNSGDEVLSVGLMLQFPVVFPDGTVTQSIDVSSNGRIAPTGALTASNFTPSVTTLLNDPTTLCPYWADLNYQGGDVFFDSRPDVAVITWQDAELFVGSTQFTFQAQLHSDGRIVFAYDDRFGVGNGIIGFSAGGQTPDPGPTDLTLLPGTVGPQNTVYEFFGEHDLTGLFLEWTPQPVAGYTFNNECARSELTAPSCARSNSAFRFVPDGSGGYSVDRLIPTFDANIGSPLALGDDSLAALTLGFPFTMPDGTATSTLDLDSNGRLILPGSDSSDFSPSAFEFLNDPTPAIAPLWTDFNPSAGGTVSFATDASRALITFDSVPQFGEVNVNTFQIALFPDSSFEIHLLNLDLRVDPSRFPLGDNVLIGTSQGQGVTTTPDIDFSTALPLQSMGSPDVYEFIDVAGAGELIDFPTTFETVSLGRPAIGGQFDLQMTGAPPGAAAGVLLFGLFDAGVELTSLLNLGVPSCIMSVFAVVEVQLPIVNGDSTLLPVQVPNDPALMGASLFAQSAAIAPNLNQVNIAIANSLRLLFGL